MNESTEILAKARLVLFVKNETTVSFGLLWPPKTFEFKASFKRL